jgi:hypothetical protein
MIIRLILTVLILGGAHGAFAENAPPASLTKAIEIWNLLAVTPEQQNAFDRIKFSQATSFYAPLARYSPPTNPAVDNDGRIEIGQNLRSFGRDYRVMASPIQTSEKPSFETYLTVLMVLNLANEYAHIRQYKNGSLNDFYTLLNNRKINEACSLYAVQQHASDISMLQLARLLEISLVGRGDVVGINALRIALEKNDVRDEFEEFREAVKSNTTNRMNTALSKIRSKRYADNMAGLKFCTNALTVPLPQNYINRATEMVNTVKVTASPSPPSSASLPLTYNP